MKATKTEKKPVAAKTEKKAATPLSRHPAYRNARRQARKGAALLLLTTILIDGGFGAADAKEHAEHLAEMGKDAAKKYLAKHADKVARAAKGKAHDAKAKTEKKAATGTIKLTDRSALVVAAKHAAKVERVDAAEAKPEVTWTVTDKGAIPAWVKAQTGGMDRKAIVAKWGEGARFAKSRTPKAAGKAAALVAKHGGNTERAKDEAAAQGDAATAAAIGAKVEAVEKFLATRKPSKKGATQAKLAQAVKAEPVVVLDATVPDSEVGKRGLVLIDEVEGTVTVVGGSK